MNTIDSELILFLDTSCTNLNEFGFIGNFIIAQKKIIILLRYIKQKNDTKYKIIANENFCGVNET